MKTVISVRLNQLDPITLALLDFWLSYPFDFSLFNKNVKDETDLPIDEVTQIITYIAEASHQNVARNRFFSICNRERDEHSQQ